MRTDAQEPWRSMLCLRVGNLGQEWRQFPLERDTAASHLPEHGVPVQWPCSVLVSPGQTPTKGPRAPLSDALCEQTAPFLLPKPSQVNSL